MILITYLLRFCQAPVDKISECHSSGTRSIKPGAETCKPSQRIVMIAGHFQGTAKFRPHGSIGTVGKKDFMMVIPNTAVIISPFEVN